MLKARNLTDFLSFFPVVKRISVQWGEQDLFQHVNNTVYFKYQEASRLKFLGLLMENIDKSYDKEGFHKGTNVGPILSDTYCRFKFPLKYPDRVLIGSTILTGGLQITTIVSILYICSYLLCLVVFSLILIQISQIIH